jgi:tRNA A37 threonylcarbamoyladenosine dehydratase
VEAVYSTEPLRYPQAGAACDLPQGGPAGLNCAGFGSVVTVTATVGLFAAARAINALSAAR